MADYVIKKAEYITSGTKKIHYPVTNLPEFVFMGRSNVGKSSFINAICKRKKLAYTSSKPGKTITLNFYNINDSFILVDVPGYGYAQKTVEDRLKFGNMIEEYLEKSEYLKSCFLIVDLRHDPTNDDVLMYNYLKHFDKKVIVIATKADKLSKNQVAHNLKRVKDVLKMSKEDMAIVVSSETRQGLELVYDYLIQELA